jgi:uncharacterized protein YprB with RNaseH-like and TPR domain
MHDTLRLRLENLNRDSMPNGRCPPAAGHIRIHDANMAQAEPVAPKGVKDAIFAPAGLLRRGEVVETRTGEHWRVRVPLEVLWPGSACLVASRQDHLRSLLTTSQHAIEPNLVMNSEFAALVAALPHRAVVLDLETCGLAGSALFLIGLLRQIEETATVELLLARNFAEEAAVLETLWRTMAEQEVLVTFNGKSFDWPMVVDRTTRHRLKTDGSGPIHHLDILHHARRQWRNRLPDCRLQTLERHVCRRQRGTDIPGNEIPAVYADYARTGFERDMDLVLYHNALDLVTLLDLALRLAA